MPDNTVSKLNELLEAERAGVEVAAALKKAHPEYTEDFEALMKDEAWSCAGLNRAVESISGAPSPATGDFATQVMALEGLGERLQLLVRGQQWVIRRIDTLLEEPLDGTTRHFLEEMRAVHERNMDWCHRTLESIAGGG